jgi:hypothetical protein
MREQQKLTLYFVRAAPAMHVAFALHGDPSFAVGAKREWKSLLCRIVSRKD